MNSTRIPKVGLLPLYLKLYDDILPERRSEFDGFVEAIGAAFESRGMTVETAPICCVTDEFDAAIQQCEAVGVDCLVTLHLAYSPSLESIDAMCRTDLPIVILDTTMDAAFGVDVSADRIMYNHGIHGVMDFASMLRRRGRAFEIVAGHYGDASTLDRATDLVRAGVASRSMRDSRVLRVGQAFAGMGDFAVAQQVLAERFGITIEQIGLDGLDAAIGRAEASVVELSDEALEYGRLLRTLKIKEALFETLASEYEQALIEEQATEPVFYVIDEPVVPERPEGPGPAVKMVLAGAVGALVGWIWVMGTAGREKRRSETGE